MANTNKTEKAPEVLFSFSLSEGKLLQSTAENLSKEDRAAGKKPEAGKGSQFRFHCESTKAGIKNAIVGTFSKQLLSIASQASAKPLSIDELNELEGAPMTIIVTVYKPQPKAEAEQIKIENNQF